MAQFHSVEATEADPEKAPVQKQELGDLVVEYLEALGVEYIFGVPGGAIEPLYNAMARSARRGGLRPIVARHEAGAAFMADGYARETGKLGVCCSTAGPGATNLLTGVAAAHADGIPLLAITAQTPISHFGKRSLQESSCTAINTVAMFQTCTKYSSLVSHRGQLEGKLISAIMATQGPPAGAAHLSIPMDIFSSPRRMRFDFKVKIDSLLRPRVLIDQGAIDSLFYEISQAEKITLLLGDGCGEAIDAILDFAALTKSPIVTTPDGKRWVSSFSPLYRGVVGFAGHESARQAIRDENNDLIIAVGTRLGELVVSGLGKDILNDRLIHIDISAESFTNSPMARLHVCGTLSSIFKQINDRLRASGGTGSQQESEFLPSGIINLRRPQPETFPPASITLQNAEKCFSNDSPIKPQRLMRELSLRLPPETRILPEAGTSWFWAIHYLHLKNAGQFRMGAGFGAMAWGMGAAIGTAMGSPGTPVVCLTGDGNYLMSAQEITVAVAEKLPVIFIVLNDQALGMVKHAQRIGGAEQVAFELPPVDFVKMAEAVGARGHSVRTVSDLIQLDFSQICRRRGPTVLDVHIDSEEIPPIGARLKFLGNSNTEKKE